MSSLTPLPFSYGRVEYVELGSDNEFADEALEEVNLTSQGYARYTVYRVANAARRVIHDNETPVVQFDTAGNGTFGAVTPADTWWPVGYFILSTPRGATDAGRVHTGHYCTAYQLFGCVSRGYVDKTITREKTCDNDTAVKREPVGDDWNDKLDAFYAKMQAEATSSGGAANSHVKVRHLAGGVARNGATFDLQDNNATSLAVTVTDDDIVVDLDTDAGNPISTAREVIAALNANADFAALGLFAELAPGENGAGVVADSGPYTLAGGRDEVDFDSLKGSIVVMKYYDNYSSGLMHAGYAIIESLDWAPKPLELIKASLTISGARHRLYRVTS